MLVVHRDGTTNNMENLNESHIQLLKTIKTLEMRNGIFKIIRIRIKNYHGIRRAGCLNENGVGWDMKETPQDMLRDNPADVEYRHK